MTTETQVCPINPNGFWLIIAALITALVLLALIGCPMPGPSEDDELGGLETTDDFDSSESDESTDTTDSTESTETDESTESTETDESIETTDSTESTDTDSEIGDTETMTTLVDGCCWCDENNESLCFTLDEISADHCPSFDGMVYEDCILITNQPLFCFEHVCTAP